MHVFEEFWNEHLLISHALQDSHSLRLAKLSTAMKYGLQLSSTARYTNSPCQYTRISKFTHISFFYSLQAKMEPQDIVNLAQTLDIQQDSISAELGPHWWPRRGLGPMPPEDPVLYRLFEVRANYD